MTASNDIEVHNKNTQKVCSQRDAAVKQFWSQETEKLENQLVPHGQSTVCGLGQQVSMCVGPHFLYWALQNPVGDAPYVPHHCEVHCNIGLHLSLLITM